MATLGSIFGGSAYAMSGPKAPKSKTPAINAANEEEEKFVKYAKLENPQAKQIQRRLLTHHPGSFWHRSTPMN